MEIKEIAIAEIEKLTDKAEKTREAHFMISRSLNRKSKLLHSFILIGSCIVAILTFADFEDFMPVITNLNKPQYTLFVGFIASIVFILTVLEEYINWRHNAQRHENAGKLLTSFIRNAKGIGGQDLITNEELKEIRTQYTSINDEIPPIPNNIFLRAKKEHLIKVMISKEIDNNPCGFIWWKRIRLRYKLKGDNK